MHLTLLSIYCSLNPHQNGFSGRLAVNKPFLKKGMKMTKTGLKIGGKMFYEMMNPNVKFLVYIMVSLH